MRIRGREMVRREEMVEEQRNDVALVEAFNIRTQTQG